MNRINNSCIDSFDRANHHKNVESSPQWMETSDGPFRSKDVGRKIVRESKVLKFFDPHFSTDAFGTYRSYEGSSNGHSIFWVGMVPSGILHPDKDKSL